jgi:hypothetical protein
MARQLEAASTEVERLTSCLARANSNHELFERRWYLTQDERDVLRTALGEACRLIGGMITELARYDDDPSTLDGHRARVAEFMRKLVAP